MKDPITVLSVRLVAGVFYERVRKMTASRTSLRSLREVCFSMWNFVPLRKISRINLKVHTTNLSDSRNDERLNFVQTLFIVIARDRFLVTIFKHTIQLVGLCLYYRWKFLIFCL